MGERLDNTTRHYGDRVHFAAADVILPAAALNAYDALRGVTGEIRARSAIVTVGFVVLGVVVP